MHPNKRGVELSVKLFPYCEVDGLPTLKDSQLAGLYERMKRDGTVEQVFFAGEVQGPDEFVAYFKNPGNHLWVHADDETQDFLGFCWLNTFEGRSARLHYNAFSEAWGQKTFEMAIQSVKTLLGMQDEQGKYFLDVLIGLTPTDNWRSCEFVKRVGAEVAGVIPKMLWNAYKQKSMDALMVYYTRENLQEQGL